MNETAFYVLGITLTVLAVVISAVGLRFEKFPQSKALMAASLGAFVLLVGATTTFGWLNAEDETDHREAEQAAGELQTPAEIVAEYQEGATAQAEEGETPETGAEEEGAVDGAELFTSEGCAGCHTLEAAGATGTTGPNLDTSLAGKDAAYIEESIVDPEAVVAKGFPAGIMPNFSDLPEADLQALVDYLSQSVGSK
jgi:mono/diheme cytochrome c family protein